jgi:acetyltransferase
MEKLFNPESIAIIGLSSKQGNIPRLVLENLIRWGYRGRIFGINPRGSDIQVNGIRMYKEMHELPIVPDLVFALIPARLIPDLMEACGKMGVKRMAIPSGGFNELNEEGGNIANLVLERARKYGIRFVGPNGVTVANTANGLCLPFVPSYSPPKGGLSIITQSGGVGLMLWNLMTDENVGMAKFASIGNKLDLDEVDFLEYFGNDPETKIIGMYL